MIINLLPDKLHEDCTEFQFGNGREVFQCRVPLRTIDIRIFSPSGWNVLQLLRQRIQILTIKCGKKVSISPKFYAQLFVPKAWLYTFLFKKIDGKAALKMLVKLTAE